MTKLKIFDSAIDHEKFVDSNQQHIQIDNIADVRTFGFKTNSLSTLQTLESRLQYTTQNSSTSTKLAFDCRLQSRNTANCIYQELRRSTAAIAQSWIPPFCD